MRKSFFIYTSILLVFGLAIAAILEHGRGLQGPPALAGGAAENATATPTERHGSRDAPSGLSDVLFAGLIENLQDPLSLLFIQLILIVLLARVFGSVFARFGQPAVIGEMVAGIVLGPSLFGWLFPDFFRFAFPLSSLGTLKLLSQVGVCLAMFVVGMTLEVSHVRHRARTAVVVSHASILVPYFLGVVLSLYLFDTLAAPGASFTEFALFMGISMSITAFPVLARIIEERGLAKTFLGSTAITCAAVDDVTAWSILAFIVATVHADGFMSAAVCISLVVGFILLLLFWVKPRLPRWIGLRELDGGDVGRSVMAGVLVFVVASALATEVMGIHALFGAFLAGVVMPPHPRFRELVKLRIEPFNSVFLLPLFFAFTGLRTQVGLLDQLESWLICLAIICVATLGKLGGTMVTARCTGMSWIDSFSLGALMNTRGLMELIALNIGYELGILSDRIFTMLVLMALVTTFLTGPLLALAERMKPRNATVQRA